jgi:DNA-binding protein HU-beta
MGGFGPRCEPLGFDIRLIVRAKWAGEALLGELVGMITKHLKKSERVRIAGLGILRVKNRADRMGRNPATGEPIQIKPSKKVAFRAAKDLKMAV